VQTDRQYEKVDLWVEVFIKEENRLVVLIFENKLQANESRENQLEYYWNRANEYYEKPASRYNFLTNFGFEATYINPEIYGVYLKLDYDFDNKLSETNEKLFMCDVEKVYRFFQKNFSRVSKRESEILYDFTEWIKNKYEEEINKFLVINLKEINNDYLSEKIYQYHIVKKIFNLVEVNEAWRENKYEIRKFNKHTLIKIGNSFGKPWVQFIFDGREKQWIALYRLEKRKEGYLDLTYYRISEINTTHKRNIKIIIDKAKLELSEFGKVRRENLNNRENKLITFKISRETNLLQLSKKLIDFNQKILKLLK